jgi:hypothetical protein
MVLYFYNAIVFYKNNIHVVILFITHTLNERSRGGELNEK